MSAGHNVPVIPQEEEEEEEEGSLRWNHNLGQLKTDPVIRGSHDALWNIGGPISVSLGAFRIPPGSAFTGKIIWPVLRGDSHKVANPA